MKYFSILLVAGLLASCSNSSSSSNNTTDTQATPSPANVQNVNGNIPDTNTGTNLNNTLPTDSSRVKDSARR